MSKYTTGELAKLCGVTVRTVQYYDTRGILIPSSLSEGGRRLYSEDDVKRMKVICFLRELDLPINAKKLFLPLAILLHMAMDTFPALYQRGAVPLWTVEIWAALWTAIVVFIAVRLYRRMKGQTMKQD